MYISCPKCDTNFTVLPEQIGEFGRKVKCSKCGHIWHQKLTQALDTKESYNIIPNLQRNNFGNGVNLPALRPIKIPRYLYITPFVLMATIIVLSALLFQYPFGIKSMLDFPKLNIRDVHIENQQEIGKVIVSYKVINTSTSNNLSMPLVRVRLFDQNNHIIKSHIADQTDVKLAPNQYVNIKTEFISPANAKNIDITLGNRLDFILR